MKRNKEKGERRKEDESKGSGVLGGREGGRASGIT
jgi:hypothetical protein